MVDFHIEHITGPDYAAPYLINGDASGLSIDDMARIDAWVKRNHIRNVSSTTDDVARFTWSYRVHFPEANCDGGSVLEYICEVTGH